jgi:RNA polymerase sigma factor (TIGR02999 family)
MNEVTRVLSALRDGDPSAAERLIPLVYDELRRLAAARLAAEKPGQTLQATALVHEAFLRLVDRTHPQSWNGRGHFFGAAAEAMRRILVESARKKRTVKAGGGRQRVELEDAAPAVETEGLDVRALDDALRVLEREEPRKAAIVKLRFFAGLTNDAAAEAVGVSSATAENDWAFARAWLRLRIDGAGEAASGGARGTAGAS